MNDRAHDLVDLQLASRVYEGSLTEIREVAMRLFIARKLHSWPPSVTRRAEWRDRYAAAADGLDVLETLDEAIDWTNDFITKIDASN